MRISVSFWCLIILFERIYLHIRGRLAFVNRIADHSTQVPIDCDHRDRQTDRPLEDMFYEQQKIEISQGHQQESRQTYAIIIKTSETESVYKNRYAGLLLAIYIGVRNRKQVLLRTMALRWAAGLEHFS